MSKTHRGTVKAKVGAIAAALALALAGCGGAAAPDSAAFVGTWAVSGYVEDGRELTADEVARVRQAGLYLTLEEDGDAFLEVNGVESEGTWKADDASKATLSVDAPVSGLKGAQELTLTGDVLAMSGQDTKVFFEQIDPADKATATQSPQVSSSSSASSTSAETSATATSGTESATQTQQPSTSEATPAEEPASVTTTVDIASLADAEELSDVVADDETCRITVLGVGDYYGDPAYLIEVENKTDAQIDVTGTSFTVAGAEVQANLAFTVAAGETGSESLWFRADAIGGGVEALQDVKGEIKVLSHSSGDVLATYAFAR